MNRIKDENYYLIHGWMINKLNLKGAKLQLFAIIYGFTQDGVNEFNGSYNYLAEFVGTTKRTIIHSLKELVDLNYLLKKELYNNNIKFVTYKANLNFINQPKINNGTYQNNNNAYLVDCISDVSNTDTNNNQMTTQDKLVEEKRKDIDYEQIKDLFNDTCVSFPKIKTLSEARKKAIKARLKKYTVNDFKEMFKIAEQSDFLKGANKRNWFATFDWLIADSNFAKVLDGNYTNKAKGEDCNGRNKADTKTNENREFKSIDGWEI